MHIEPGLIAAPKMVLSYATGAAAFAATAHLAYKHITHEGLVSLLAKSLISSTAVFTFFEVFFHVPVGVSEVHLILGTSLLLLLGVAPAAIGLALGLLIQGVFFAPFDLPQYGANVSTLLYPLFATQLLASRIISPEQKYVNLKYSQAFKLSLAYQGGIITWVAFWAFYGQGFTAANFHSIWTFGLAYLSILLIEPIADLGLLALTKTFSRLKNSPLARILLHPRLFDAS